MKIIATQLTFFKSRLVDSSLLGQEEKKHFYQGIEVEIQPNSLSLIRRHYRVLPIGKEAVEGNYWYIFEDHARIEGEKSSITVNSFSLDIAYKSQRDNWLNPDGACNVTCIAMALQAQGIKQLQPNDYSQFEDELYDRSSFEGLSRHEGEDLAILASLYGAKDEFTKYGSIEACKQAIWDTKKPVIIHGFFTNFGHIVLVIGWDENGLIIHDPYGEWNSWGYDKNDDVNQNRGESKHYSYELIKECCMPDGYLWMHVFS